MIGHGPMQDFLLDVERRQRDAVSVLPPDHRSARGQFMTPPPVAALMASFFPRLPSRVRLLDPGAGCGALTAAFVLEACARASRPASLEVVAFEIEDALVPVLRQTLEACRRECKKADIEFSATVRSEDFLEAATASHGGSLFPLVPGDFSHVIINPPYHKIAAASHERCMLRKVGIEATNAYAAFVLLALRLLAPRGQLVAITPRSFCNGPYFSAFRQELLTLAAFRRAHLFRRRDVAFDGDAVLQENIIFQMTKGAPDTAVRISVSDGPHGRKSTRTLPFASIVHPSDAERFIHLPVEDDDVSSAHAVRNLPCRLEDLDIQVSTGRVVDFRARQMLASAGTEGTVPLIWSSHMTAGRIAWPAERCRKPEAIRRTRDTEALLVPSAHYVLTKRFSTKEERRRVVAAHLTPSDTRSDALGIENHLNYFHRNGGGLDAEVARGLTAFLNSDQVDRFFRQFSGHTQVNATDLRSLRYPTLAQLRELGRSVTREVAPR